MTTVSLNELFTNDQEALEFALKNGLLYIHGECEECGGRYELFRDAHKRNEKYLKCIKCGSKKSVLHNSIFTRSKLKPNEVLHILYCWSIQNSRKVTAHECQVSKATVTNFFQAFRDACVDWLNDQGQKPIGGNGYTVEIDESLMSTRKYNRGRMLSPQWVFGGYCVETKEKFVLSVPNRTAGTLLPIIQQYISPNSNISSDSWRAYNHIEDLKENYKHNTVNHKHNFVNPITGCHTQHIERMWREVKRVKKRYEGINSKDVDSHLAEFQWRERNQVTLENAFSKAVKLISETYFY